jgi:hypothetical protein
VKIQRAITTIAIPIIAGTSPLGASWRIITADYGSRGLGEKPANGLRDGVPRQSARLAATGVTRRAVDFRQQTASRDDGLPPANRREHVIPALTDH